MRKLEEKPGGDWGAREARGSLERISCKARGAREAREARGSQEARRRASGGGASGSQESYEEPGGAWRT